MEVRQGFEGGAAVADPAPATPVGHSSGLQKVTFQPHDLKTAATWLPMTPRYCFRSDEEAAALKAWAAEHGSSDDEPIVEDLDSEACGWFAEQWHMQEV